MTILKFSLVKSILTLFFINPVGTFDIKSIVKNMNAKKSCRSDSPKIQFIKLSIDIISPIIAKIFNICFLQGVFPNSFKKRGFAKI